MMINTDIGRQAIMNQTLLKEVVNIKKTFYNREDSNTKI